MQPRLGQGAVGDCFGEGIAEIIFLVVAVGGFLVEAAHGGGHRRMHRSPIRQHEALISPIAFQYLVQQKVVFAGIHQIDAIISAHHGARIAVLDRNLESQQIAFAHRLFGDVGAHRVAPGFLIVQCEVFDRRNDIDVLRAVNGFARHRPGQQGILADIFESASAARVARQIDAARQHDVKALVARFGADHRAARICHRSVPGGRRQKRRR